MVYHRFIVRIMPWFLPIAAILASCAGGNPAEAPPPPNLSTTPADDTASTNSEQPIQLLPVAGPLRQPEAEISGMAWYDDQLILLPQYPIVVDPTGDGALLMLAKADIQAAIDGTNNQALQPVPIALNAHRLTERVVGFEGFEAITIVDNVAFLTIEAFSNGITSSYLISGTINPDLMMLTLNTDHIVSLETQSNIDNISNEAILSADDRIVTIYEVNGRGVNSSPVTREFNRDLELVGTMPFPPLEYRVTDATRVDRDNRFWVINYFFPGDTALLPERDPLVEVFGQGQTHALFDHVERLVELQYNKNGITLTNTPPIQLVLEADARNWEGIVRFDEQGFLLVTDTFPETLLAFVSKP
ncbi:MAG: hypothetical protein HC837_06330 [Chloroflexaceae bacterium]|nr:hypothetical protein [Chloroflexaceae bacterium]